MTQCCLFVCITNSSRVPRQCFVALQLRGEDHLTTDHRYKAHESPHLQTQLGLSLLCAAAFEVMGFLSVLLTVLCSFAISNFTSTTLMKSNEYP